VGRDERRRFGALRKLGVEKLGTLGVEPVERLVEQQQVGVVEEGPGEREPLEHATREGRDPLVARAPEPEALEHRARPLAPIRQSVEPAIEVEVLERRQLAVDEGLVAEKPDRTAGGVDFELTVRRRVEPGAEPQQGRFPRAVGPGHEHEPAARHLEIERFEDALVTEALRQFPGANHAWSLDFRRLRTQARPIVLVCAAVLLAGGCGSETQSDARNAAGAASREIVFTVNRDGWNEIWTMDANGENRHRLTDSRPSGSDAAGNTSPAWSPDGQEIAFVGSGEGSAEDANAHELYVMNADGSDVRQLTKNDKLDADPSWSPDGNRIVFVQAEGWGTEHVRMSLRIIDADGSHERVLREEKEPGPVFLASPAWSPDGTRIAFSRTLFTEVSAKRGVYVMTSDGSHVTLAHAGGAQPAWSPDGKWFAFTSDADEFGETCFHECSPSGEIYISDGDRLLRLTKSEAEDMSPAWSTFGDEIVFSSDRSNPEEHELELYVVSADGGKPRRITRNKVWDLDPDWRPTSVADGSSGEDESRARRKLQAWRGFRTRSGGIHCFMTGEQAWNGFMCFRATDGLFVRMAGRDLSTEDPARVVTGTDPALLGYENAEITEIEPGNDWSSSDAEMVHCSVRQAAVECRHASGHGFFLDQTRHKTF
jgi:Tol biopolymer transport system component